MIVHRTKSRTGLHELDFCLYVSQIELDMLSSSFCTPVLKSFKHGRFLPEVVDVKVNDDDILLGDT